MFDPDAGSIEGQRLGHTVGGPVGNIRLKSLDFAEHLDSGWEIGPRRRKPHRRPGLHQAGSEGMIEGKSGRIGAPVRIGQHHLLGRANQDFLNIAPSKIRVGLQHQRHHTRYQRRRGGGAAEVHRVVLVEEVERGCRRVVAVGAHAISRDERAMP